MGKHGEPIRVGKTFGKFTVLKAVGLRGGQHHWTCRCECGKMLELSRHVLRYGNKTDCGCSKIQQKKKYKVREDLTGRKFNRLTVLGRSEKISKEGQLWECVCECGGRKIVSTHGLKSGKPKSCGCARRRPLIDLTGQTFGKFTVLSRAENFHGQTMWNCRCECGETEKVNSRVLRDGKKIDCGCSSVPLKRGPNFKDITGHRFGGLTVIRRSPKLRNHRGNILWTCKCDCGNLHEVAGVYLRANQVLSCGCFRRGGLCTRIDLTGRRFGKLIALSYEHIRDSHGRRRPKWRCKCDCGNTHLVGSSALRSGNTKSCGCSRRNGKPLLRPDESAFQTLIGGYRKGAKQRNIAFTLTEKQFRGITKRDCHYCGASPSLSGTRRRAKSGFRYNGIDRVNNGIGYTPENSVPACKTCNFMKGRLPIDSFLQQINKIQKHQNQNRK